MSIVTDKGGFTLCLPLGNPASTNRMNSQSLWHNRPPSPVFVPLAGMLPSQDPGFPPGSFLLCLILSALSEVLYKPIPLPYSGPISFPFKAKFLEMMALHPHILIHTVENLVSTSASHFSKVTNALLKAHRRVRLGSLFLASL